MSKKVLLGMSGGVDSSVAAYLLKEQGYEVIGCTMHLFDACEDNACCGIQGTLDAKMVCKQLDIPHLTVSFKQEFKEHVIDYFVESYRKGLTPNPCIACNRYIKWDSMLKFAKEQGADYIATGHYAKVKMLENGRYAIMRSESDSKDQTYALYGLTQEMLAHTLMPVGEYEKSEIRRIADEIDLVVADKPDSQEICFVEDNDYAGYVERCYGYKEKTGDFVDTQGNVLGEHKGISCYTIGQRKGLGIAFGEPKYVLKLDTERNQVVLGSNEELMTDVLSCKDINFMGASEFNVGDRLFTKIRYSHKGEMATVTGISDCMTIHFDKPVRAVTPGQAVVFYRDGAVLGGGTICGNE